MMTKEKLDWLCVRGCTDPNCNEDHCGELWFHQRCHGGCGLDAAYTDAAALVLNCRECGVSVLEIGVLETVRVRSLCHPSSPVYARYQHGGGELELFCRECHDEGQAPFAVIPVAAEMPAHW